MNEEFKNRMITALETAIRNDVLNETDILSIIDICSTASERKKIDLAEKYMINAIGGEIQ